VVRKIKKKTKASPDALCAVPLVLAVTALAGPRREGREVRRSFSPTWQVRDFFLDHFNVDIVSTNRPLSLDEYVAWPGAADLRWALRAAGEPGAILTKAPQDLGEISTPQLGVLPLIARVPGSDVESLGDLWRSEFPEVARVALTNIFNEAWGLIPGYDRPLFTPPRHARDLNGSIAHLNALVADECALGDGPLPRPFPSCADRMLATIPTMAKI
jgi:hypothetical protein